MVTLEDYTVKKNAFHPQHPDEEQCPTAGRRVAALLDAAREQVNDPSPASYARVLRQVETVAEILRETPLDEEDWNEGPRVDPSHAPRPLARAIARELARDSSTAFVVPREAGPSLTLEDAREVIKALRRSDAVRHELQLAIGGS